MADLMETSSIWLDAKMKGNLSRAVTIRRGAASVELSASIGRTVYETVDEGGAAITHETRDFLLDAADLILSGVETEPQLGDLFEEGTGAAMRRYEVLEIQGEGCWRWSGGYHTKMRVHTKEISAEGD